MPEAEDPPAMNEPYERLHFRVERGAWPAVARDLHGSVARALEEVGATVHALWRGRIGIPTDEGRLVLRRESAEAELCVGPAALELAPAATALESARLVAGGLPCPAESPSRPGVYMHRQDTLRAEDYAEFRDRSERAWSRLAELFGSQVVGFWRELDVPAPLTRVMTVTWYEDLATWERSVGAAVEEAPEELVASTVVHAMELVPPG